jgi:uncharacterized membrane protein SpoIIM required for sporulation
MLKIIVGKRWPLIAGLFVIEIALIIAISNYPFFPSELSTYENQYSNLAPVLNASAPSQVGAIFSNNMKVATVELIPVFGLLIFGLSLYETARVVEAIAAIKGFSVTLALANLFLLPSTWLELPAYSVAAAESVYLTYNIYLGFKRGRGWFMRELRFLLVNIGLITMTLIVAAFFEVSEIQIASGPPETQPYALLTWLPFVIVLVVVVRFWRRARREAPVLDQPGEPVEPASVAKFGPESSQGGLEKSGRNDEKEEAGSPAPS